MMGSEQQIIIGPAEFFLAETHATPSELKPFLRRAKNRTYPCQPATSKNQPLRSMIAAAEQRMTTDPVEFFRRRAPIKRSPSCSCNVGHLE